MRAGSELHLAVEAAKELEGAGKKARVVSMLSWEVFEEQARPAVEHVPQSCYEELVGHQQQSAMGWGGCCICVAPGMVGQGLR